MARESRSTGLKAVAIRSYNIAKTCIRSNLHVVNCTTIYVAHVDHINNDRSPIWCVKYIQANSMTSALVFIHLRKKTCSQDQHKTQHVVIPLSSSFEATRFVGMGFQCICVCVCHVWSFIFFKLLQYHSWRTCLLSLKDTNMCQTISDNDSGILNRLGDKTNS